MKLKLRRGTGQHIESELYAYPDTKREISLLREEILHESRSGSYEYAGGGRSSLPGDPTGQTALRLVTHRKLEQMGRITEAIEATYHRLLPEKKKLVELKYWTPARSLTWDGIAIEIGIHRATAFRWRDEIIGEIAERIGWW